jgi:hypothetical protein
MIEKTTISKGKKLFGFTVVYDAITMKPKLLTTPMIVITPN